MEEVRLRVRAPFATFRRYVGTEYRGTYEVMTPSAAYGFVLNVACIDANILKAPIRFQVAVGLVKQPTVSVQFQQVHRAKPSERVGDFGFKPGVASVAKREFLVDYDGVIAVRCDPDLARRIRQGLRGEVSPHYGNLFLGDNDYLVDWLSEETVAARWYRRGIPKTGRACSLTLFVDRSKPTIAAETAMFHPTEPTEQIDEDCWVSPFCERS